MNALALVRTAEQVDLTAVGHAMLDEFAADLAAAVAPYPIAIPLTDPDVMAGDYAPEVVKRRIHRRARVIQCEITRVKIRLDGAGVS